MSLAAPRTLTIAWGMLAVVTVASVWTAETVPWRLLAVAAIMAIAAIKALLILFRFMALAAAPIGIRGYMIGWTLACAAMIFGLYWGGVA